MNRIRNHQDRYEHIDDMIPGEFSMYPHVTEEGEVMIELRLYTTRFTYWEDVTEVGFFYKLEGLPPILQINYYYGDLILLTQDGNLIHINKNNPTGTVINNIPIKKLKSFSHNLWVIDKSDNLYNLEKKSNGSYQLSDLFIPNVKLISYIDIKRIFVVIDRDNVMYTFPHGDIEEEPGILQLDFEAKLAYDRYVVSTNGRIFSVKASARDNSQPILELIKTLDYEFRYHGYRDHTLHTIDYDGIWRTHELYKSTMRDIIQSGTYDGFYQFNPIIGILIAIGENRNAIATNSGPMLFEVPFRLMNVEAFEERRRASRRIKSARFVVDF